MSANLYIVPHDFTSVGDRALKYAIFLSKPSKASILLVHIVNDKKKITNAKKKLEGIIDNLDLMVGSASVKSKVIQGSIFNDIPKVAKKHEGRFIVMGTHGAVGMQKIFGSYAMKVINNSHIPFLVVQDGSINERMKNIVVPVTTEKESFQSINAVIDIAKNFDSKVTILAEKQTDVKFATQLHARLRIVEEKLAENHVDFTHHIIKEKGSYQSKIIQFANKNECDLIAFAYDSSGLFPALEKYTQQLITNDKNIPCMVINAKLLQKYYY